MASCDSPITTSLAYTKNPDIISVPPTNQIVYADISASAIFDGDDKWYGVNVTGSSGTPQNNMLISGSGKITLIRTADCPTSRQYYELQDCETSTLYYSNFSVLSDDDIPDNSILQDYPNAYIRYNVNGKIFNTGSLTATPNAVSSSGTCPSFTFYEYRVNAQTGSGNPSSGTAACTPNLSVPIYTTESTLDSAIANSSYSNVSQFLYNTSSLTNLFNGGDGRYGIGNVGDTVPRSVIRINTYGVSSEGEVAECQSLPSISATKVDIQPNHSESINLASSFSDPSFNPNIQSQIVEHGFFIGTDSGSSNSNTKYISTGSNKTVSATVTANQTAGPGIEWVEFNYFDVSSLTQIITSTANGAGEITTASICMVADNTSSLRDYINTDPGNSNPSSNENFTVTIDTGSIGCGDTPLTSSWDTYSGLTHNTQYYAWAYASSSLGITTSSRIDFKTIPNNLIAVQLGGSANNYSSVSSNPCIGTCGVSRPFDSDPCYQVDSVGIASPTQYTVYVSGSTPSASYYTDIQNTEVYSDYYFTTRQIYPLSDGSDSWGAFDQYRYPEYSYMLSQSQYYNDITIGRGGVNLESTISNRLTGFNTLFFCSASCC